MVPAATYPDLQDRCVVVTGGASGIGEGLVEAFAAQGARVGFIDIADAEGRALAARLGGTVRFEHADLTDTAALHAAIGRIRDAFGPVRVLLNNAAHDERHSVDRVDDAYFDGRIAVNLKHQFFAAQAVLPDMVAAGGGSIVMFGSHSWLLGMGGMPLYSASKAAILGLTRALARDYGPNKVRVNHFAPGWTMTRRQLDNWLTPEADAMRAARQCLPDRLYPADIARVALFLASDQSAAITAQTIVADGGWA
ncbi:MAG: SDR family oxidoreductase [Rhodobacteraceae bacterium]|jgi:NAD(P)-dependent dehydrogenase (short-subunit alcohol dehydrogenase family)|nr:SDR family oxidoreductase [Paracoccaceae bacterium]